VSLLVPALAFTAPLANVTNGNNDGAGSLRAALTSGATKVFINPSVSTIVVKALIFHIFACSFANRCKYS
jgi:hypothetical protein